MGDEPRGSPPSSPPRKKAPSQAPKSPGMESVVYSEEEVYAAKKEVCRRSQAATSG